MRSVFKFNNDWLYAARELSYGAPDDDFHNVTLPHTNILLPMRNFDNLEYQFISTYRKHFTLPEPLNGRRVFIDFDGAMTSSTVLINGVTLGDHDGGYVPFSFELTDHLRTGENTLQVRLDSTERPDVPPNGAIVDYLTFGGIYRDVYLRIVEPVYIERIFAKPLDVLTSPALDVDVYLSGGLKTGARIKAVLKDAAGAMVSEISHPPTGETSPPDPLSVGEGEPGYQTNQGEGGEEHQTAWGEGGRRSVTVSFGALTGIKLWTPNDPVLYTVEVEVWDGETQIDAVSTRIGFRHAIFKDDGFYLNGERLKLVGLNRHQTYPYIGAAAPERLQRKDADILKDELGVNIVRTSHYPQSPHFLNRCDEIGLLVFEEIPGWQFIGDSDWQALSLRDVRVMIERDCNHPSIILWGVRINESWDDNAFYKATNALAHQLDPTRQTGGVRFFQESEFLEDVFTYNDFAYDIRDPLHSPHLITEFGGHMFSTKTSDQEERQIEHALRHAHKQDLQLGRTDVTGAIGWCFFDYNTHRQFGSGDRVCYHGVTDMFRLPKYAAYIYEAQIPPSVRPVLRPLVNWSAPGDRSGGGYIPLIIFTNCDEVEVFTGDESRGRGERMTTEFPNLPHAPFKFGELGLEHGLLYNFRDLHVIGYIGGQAVIEYRAKADGVPQQLTLEADDAELNADGADMTRLVFKVVDEFGNRLTHANHVISFTISGEGVLIGDNPFPIIGGQAAVYVKATHTPGTITVHASAPRLNRAEVVIRTK